jgi:hypothetical protein
MLATIIDDAIVILLELSTFVNVLVSSIIAILRVLIAGINVTSIINAAVNCDASIGTTFILSITSPPTPFWYEPPKKVLPSGPFVGVTIINIELVFTTRGKLVKLPIILSISPIVKVLLEFDDKLEFVIEVIYIPRASAISVELVELPRNMPMEINCMTRK